MREMRVAGVALAMVLLCGVLPARAGQAPAKAAAGEEIIVTYAGSGQELRGRMVELSPTSLAILVNGQRVEVPIGDVLRIEVRYDSLKNGTIIGAAILGGLTAATCAAFASEDAVSGCATALVFNTVFGAL